MSDSKSVDVGSIRFRHVRNVLDDGTVSNMGGCTFAYKEVDGGIRVSAALCSNKDNFNRKIGRTIAAGRLHSETQSVVVPISWEKFINVLPYDMSGVHITKAKKADVNLSKTCD
jgi:hypothetical protein